MIMSEGRFVRPKTPTLAPGPSLNAAALVVVAAVSVATLAAVLAYGAVIASNTSRTRAAIKRIPDDPDVQKEAAISNGQVPGVTVIHKFGMNSDVGLAQETIWSLGGLYPFLLAAERLEINGTSILDTAGGDGARVITLIGIGADGLGLTEEVTMNGLVAVQTANAFFRIPRVRVSQAGTTRANVGAITITSVDTATPQADIAAGTGTTQMGVYSMANDKVGSLTSFTISAETLSGADRQHIAIYRRAGTTTTLVGDWSLRGGGTSSFAQPFEVPIRLDPGTDIEFRADNTAPGAIVSVFFTVVEQDV